MKDNSITKMNNIVQLGCLISKLLRLFVDFPSAIVGILYHAFIKVGNALSLSDASMASAHLSKGERKIR
jgi:hypothetical protein